MLRQPFTCLGTLLAKYSQTLALQNSTQLISWLECWPGAQPFQKRILSIRDEGICGVLIPHILLPGI